MAGIEENLMNFLRQYLPQSPPQTPDYQIPQGPSQWSMPSNTPRAQRIARAKQESAQADVATDLQEQKIREWLAQAQKGEHKVTSPVDVDLKGTNWERQYHFYVSNYNSVLRQLNKIDDDLKAGKMSQADYDKAYDAMTPAIARLNAIIKQLDAQRMSTARQELKSLHGDYRI